MRVPALPSLRQLRYFTRLARRGSFSRAADDCLVSQSTLSAGIRELESILGAEIVDRSSREFALTPTGQAALPRAQEILGLAEDLVIAAQPGADPLSGPLTLGVIPTIGPFLLPSILPKLADAHPGLKLYLREEQTERLIEGLRDGEVDLALLAFPYAANGIAHELVGEDAFWLAEGPGAQDAPVGKEIETSDLSDMDLLLLEEGHCLRDHALEACSLKSSAGARAFEATSLFTLVQMVKGGLGATLLPDMAVKAGLARDAGVEVRPFKAPAPLRHIGVAWRAGSAREQAGIALASKIRSYLAENVSPH